MGKFKEIDQFCKNDDREGLVDFLAEHGVQNPHKQANIYLEEYKMTNKTVSISDINKEIASEMQLEKKKSPIDGYFNHLDEIITITSERVSLLSETFDVLSERIDVINERIDNIMDYFNKKSGG